MKFYNFLYFLKPHIYVAIISYLIIVNVGCATIGAPEGGDKDLQAPKLVKASPNLNTINFVKGKKIELKWNEFINIKNKDQIIASPPLANLEVKLKSKTIEINWKDTLKPKTTYVINFGNEIEDITEANKVSNFKYVFSTGTYIDTLQCQGAVANSSTGKVEKNVLIMLYSNIADSTPSKEKPYYFTRTDEFGAFNITNIKAGKYKLFALKDENTNMLYDLPNEAFAYSDTLINIGAKNNFINLYLCLQKQQKQKIKSCQLLDAGIVKITLNNALDTNSTIIVNNTKLEKSNILFNSNYDTIQLFSSFQNNDSLSIQIKNNLFDSTVSVKNNNLSQDSILSKRFKLRLNLNLKEENSNAKTTKKNILSAETPKNSDVKANIKKLLFNNANLTAYTNHPIAKINSDQIYLLSNKTKTSITSAQIKFLNTVHTKFELSNIKWEIGKKYTFICPKGSMMDIYGKYNDSTAIDFEIADASQLSSIKVIITDSVYTSNLLVMLTDKDGAILATQKLEQNKFVVFNKLMSNTYKIKLLHDENNNGFWDTGDYYLKTQPEKYIFYKKEINLKPNWEQEIEIR